MVDVLKQNYPDSIIDILVNKRVIDLIDDYPNINKVHSIEKDSFKAIKDVCKNNGYDIAIIVYPRFIIALAVFMSGIKKRLGTGYRWYSFLFNLKRHQHRKYAEKHELEFNLDMLTELDCKIPDKIKLNINVSGNTTESLKSKIYNFDWNGNFIIIHPGSMGSAKRWRKENFIELIKLIQTDTNLYINIVLTGSQDEEVLLYSIEKKVNSNNLFTITNLNLKELATLIKQSQMFVSNSTGPIHIAAAVGTFVVGLYPAKLQESAARWGPYTDKKKIFSSGLKDEESEFLEDINPLEVYEFIKSYLSK